jgi:hypothetical protein
MSRLPRRIPSILAMYRYEEGVSITSSLGGTSFSAGGTILSRLTDINAQSTSSGILIVSAACRHTVNSNVLYIETSWDSYKQVIETDRGRVWDSASSRSWEEIYQILIFPGIQGSITIYLKANASGTHYGAHIRTVNIRI